VDLRHSMLTGAPRYRWHSAFGIILTTWLVLGAVASTAGAQTPPADSAALPATSSQPPAAPPAIPVPEIVTRGDAAAAMLRSLEADLTADGTGAVVEDQLPALAREVDARLDDTNRIVKVRPSLDTLRSLNTDWRSLTDNLRAWKRDLTNRATHLEREMAQLAELGAIWHKTRELAGSSNAPAELLERAEGIIAAVNRTRSQVDDQRAKILRLQSRVAEQEARCNAALTSVQQARDAMVGYLFVRDSAPIWSAVVRARAGSRLIQESQDSINTQRAALREYVKRRSDRFLFHLVIVGLLASSLYWARRRAQRSVKADPSLRSATLVLDFPIATALLLSILMSSWIYPQMPRMLSALLGAAALVPTIVILRRLVARPMFPILNALILFYFTDRLRDVAQALPVLSRLLFLAEMLGGMIFLIWIIRSARLSNLKETERHGLWRSSHVGVRVTLLVFAIACAASAIGYVSFARLIGEGMLGGAYVAVILYVAIQIVEGLLTFALRIRPLSLLGMVRTHRELVQRKLLSGMHWLAGLTWVLIVLELVSLRNPLMRALTKLWRAELAIGELHISLGHVVAFVLTVWLAFLLSRLLRFILEEDVYPRVELVRGVPYAISTMLHYIVLLLGFFLALVALGINLDRFAILAGAFGVGIGFGLQNVVNNFVSGIILLFERPVKVGDVVQLGERGGELKRIGLRASVLRTWEGSEVIVPNGRLISDEVVNWTLSDQQRRLELSVGVAYGTAPERVIEILLKVASAHPGIMSDPAPQALFVSFGDSALEFLLRVWTTRYERWVAIRSELMVGVNAALREAGITIPFPQRDLHVQSIGPEVRKALRDGERQDAVMETERQ